MYIASSDGRGGTRGRGRYRAWLLNFADRLDGAAIFATYDDAHTNVSWGCNGVLRVDLMGGRDRENRRERCKLARHGAYSGIAWRTYRADSSRLGCPNCSSQRA